MNEKIEHEGIIFRMENRKVWVAIVQNSACADCHAKSMCRLSEQKEKLIEIPDVDTSFHVGDKVVVVGSASLGLQAVLYTFAIPLILIIATLVFFLSYFKSETIAALVSIAALVVYFLILHSLRDKFKKKFVFMMK